MSTGIDIPPELQQRVLAEARRLNADPQWLLSRVIELGFNELTAGTDIVAVPVPSAESDPNVEAASGRAQPPLPQQLSQEGLSQTPMVGRTTSRRRHTHAFN